MGKTVSHCTLRMKSYIKPPGYDMISSTNRIRALRKALRPLKQWVRETRFGVLRRLGWLGQKWEVALPEELLFWQRALEDPDGHWLRCEYDERMNSRLVLQT